MGIMQNYAMNKRERKLKHLHSDISDFAGGLPGKQSKRFRELHFGTQT
jgi:hypothetical protein